MAPKSLSSGKGKRGIVETKFWEQWKVESVNSTQWTVEQSKSPKNTKIAEKNLTELTLLFEDPEVVILPNEFRNSIHCWKRPIDLLDESLRTRESFQFEDHIIITTIDESSSLNQLFNQNAHLIHSDYYLKILSAFETLLFHPKWSSNDFPNFGFMNWKPKNHIYSLTKVESGLPHESLPNPSGKYIIRLYHCGIWRQIIVDDRIPMSKHGKPLIPIVISNETIELWSLLIIKGILKLNRCKIIDPMYYKGSCLW